MNEMQRHLTGWTLIGLPFLFHTVFELFWKVSLRGVPELVVDTMCGTAVILGVYVLVRPIRLRAVSRYK